MHYQKKWQVPFCEQANVVAFYEFLVSFWSTSPSLYVCMCAKLHKSEWHYFPPETFYSKCTKDDAKITCHLTLNTGVENVCGSWRIFGGLIAMLRWPVLTKIETMVTLFDLPTCNLFLPNSVEASCLPDFQFKRYWDAWSLHL